MALGKIFNPNLVTKIELTGCHFNFSVPLVEFIYIFCYLIRDLLSQANSYITQHALRGGVGDVLQGTLEDQSLIMSGLVNLWT